MKNRKTYAIIVNLIFLLPLVMAQVKETIPNLEQQLMQQGLVNIQTLAPDILVELKYSTQDNFLGKDTYADLENCYLQPKAAGMLKAAQQKLQAINPNLSLLVYDGARPRSVQRIMWALVVNTPSQEYVANPDRGSVHNFGSAVDLTIASVDGSPLDMGTPFDYFGKLAHPKHEAQLLSEGKLNQEQIDNRKLLRKVMTESGFQTISNEWWHFNAVSVKDARANYRIIE